MVTRTGLRVLFILLSGFTISAVAETVQPVEIKEETGVTGNLENVETVQSMFKMGGFGTLGVSHTNQRMGDYVVDGTVPKGPGRSNDWAWGNDSRIGVQATARFSPEISAIIQVISEYQVDSTYRPAVEWANVKYAFTPNIYLRAGRIVLPTFLYSDNRKVGYSFPWIHPPVDLYRQRAITNSDGIDALYRFVIGPSENSIQLIYGKNTLDYPTTTSISRGIRGIVDTLEVGPAKVRVTYMEREFISRNNLTGTNGAWTPSSDLSVGASYDPGPWFALYGWIERKSTTKINAMYVSAGYRVKKFTPYLTYSQDSPASFLPGFPTPTVAAVQSAKNSQNTVSLGVRWDFMKNTDLKLQFDQVKLSDQSNGNLANVPAGTSFYGAKFHVMSAVLDFIF